MLPSFLSKTTILLVASALALVSCARDEAELLPTAEGSYSRAVVYLDQASPARHDTAYHSPALQLAAKLSRTSCTLYLTPASQQEALAFLVPRAQMPATLLGHYVLRAPVNPGQAPSYHYGVNKADKPAGGQGWSYESWWLPSTGAATGAVDITAYDAEHHLLSGRFQLTLTGVYDPRAPSTQYVTRRCDLSLAGSFTNVVVTQED